MTQNSTCAFGVRQVLSVNKQASGRWPENGGIDERKRGNENAGT